MPQDSRASPPSDGFILDISETSLDAKYRIEHFGFFHCIFALDLRYWDIKPVPS